MRISTTQFYNNGTNSILDQQAKLSKTQLQVSTGKRVMTPSDDPVASTQILYFKESIAQTERFQLNNDAAKNRVNLQETTLGSVTNVLNRIRDLLLQAGDGTNSSTERKTIGDELEGRLNELLGLANTQYAGSEYIFAGSKVNVQPFKPDGAGNFIYQGDQSQRLIQISSSINVPVADSGYEVFQHIITGNGSFVTSEAGTNTGTGVIDSGSVSDTTQFSLNPTDNYSISFSTDPSGNLIYDVDDVTTSTNLVTGAAFTPGQAISFAGRTVTITGTPASGDQFNLAPSQNQDLFRTVQLAIDAVRTPAETDAGKAHLENALGRSLTNIDQAMVHIDYVHADVGTRLNMIDNENSTNADYLVTTKTTLSSVEDLDYVKAISQLQQQQISLQAAQQSFSYVQNLSLFNYLK